MIAFKQDDTKPRSERSPNPVTFFCICFYWPPRCLCHLSHQEAHGASIPSGGWTGNVGISDHHEHAAKSSGGRARQELTRCQPARLLLTGSSARLLMWSPTLPKTVHSWKIKNVDLRYKYWKWDWLAWKSSLRKITCSYYPDISYAKTILALDYLLPVPFALQYFLMQVHGAFSFCRHY